jgi:hypothetical protein
MEIWEEADLLTEQSLDDIKELIKDLNYFEMEVRSKH